MMQPSTRTSSAGVMRIALLATPEEFAAERRHLLEYALPELQRHYLQRGIEVEMVSLLTPGRRWQPRLCADVREEIADCHNISQFVFVLILAGDRRGPCSPPAQLTQVTFDRLRQWAAANCGRGASLLEAAYARDENSAPPQLVYRADRENGNEHDPTELVNLLRKAEREGVFSFPSVLEDLVESALGLSEATPSRCLLAVRPEGAQSSVSDDVTSADSDVTLMRQWRQSLIQRLAPENVVTMRHSSTGAASAGQLQQFSSDVTQRVKQLVTKATATKTTGEVGRKTRRSPFRSAADSKCSACQCDVASFAVVAVAGRPNALLIETLFLLYLYNFHD